MKENSTAVLLANTQEGHMGKGSRPEHGGKTGENMEVMENTKW